MNSLFVLPILIKPGIPPQHLTAPLLTDTDTFYTQIITVGAVTLTPALFSESDTFYTHVLSIQQFLVSSLFVETDTFFTPTVVPLVSLVPDADQALGFWEDELGATTDVFQSIDEDTPNDSDYIISPALGGSSADLIVRLLEGSTEIVEWTHTNISTSLVTTTQILSPLEFAAITDFTNLFIEFEDKSGNIYRTSISDPLVTVAEPFIVRYRYRKIVS